MLPSGVVELRALCSLRIANLNPPIGVEVILDPQFRGLALAESRWESQANENQQKQCTLFHLSLHSQESTPQHRRTDYPERQGDAKSRRRQFCLLWHRCAQLGEPFKPKCALQSLVEGRFRALTSSAVQPRQEVLFAVRRLGRFIFLNALHGATPKILQMRRYRVCALRGHACFPARRLTTSLPAQ